MSRLNLCFAILGCLAGANVRAAPADPPKTNLHTQVPPPPAIDDPGVQTNAPAPSPASPPPTAATDTVNDALSPPDKPDTRPVRDKASRNPSGSDTARRVASSDVTIRKQGNDRVEEYRQAGHVWMIRIVPPNGPVQTFYDRTGNGRLTRDPREGPISPVYYTLYEWN
ncbi:MAG: DUF2782 domain-containing protein [Rhodanobacteraceae bacterium]